MLVPDVAMRIRLPRVDVSLPRLHQNAAKSSAKCFVMVRNVVCCALLLADAVATARMGKATARIDLGEP